MTEHNCQLLHLDNEKETLIIGYIGEPHDALTPDLLDEQLSALMSTQDHQPLFINVVPLNVFGLRVAEQQAIVTFITENKDDTNVAKFITHFNNTEDDIENLFMKGGAAYVRDYMVNTTSQLLDDLLIDAMLAQVHA